MACAYGLFELLKAKGVDAEICYKGSIDKTVTAKMVRLLDIAVKEYMSADKFSKEDEIILVDAQKGNSNIIDMNGHEIICIDHHPVYEHVDYRFSDIRPEVGACASIIASYYFDRRTVWEVRRESVKAAYPKSKAARQDPEYHETRETLWE